MTDTHELDTRSAVLELLLDKVAADTYPSGTMLDLIESLATPDDIPAYAEVLMEKVRSDTYPSHSLMRRLLALTGS